MEGMDVGKNMESTVLDTLRDLLDIHVDLLSQEMNIVRV